MMPPLAKETNMQAAQREVYEAREALRKHVTAVLHKHRLYESAVGVPGWRLDNGPGRGLVVGFSSGSSQVPQVAPDALAAHARWLSHAGLTVKPGQDAHGAPILRVYAPPEPT